MMSLMVRFIFVCNAEKNIDDYVYDYVSWIKRKATIVIRPPVDGGFASIEMRFVAKNNH